MAKRRDRDSERFRWFEDDRSGFQFGFQPDTSYPNAYSRESGRPVKDGSLKVSPQSYDMPPPSKKSLGGEGDSSGDPRANSDFAVASNVTVIPPESTKVIINVNSSSSISWNLEPVIYITGSNVTQVMSVNPQITAGNSSQQITLMCVGSDVTFLNGSGLTLNTPSFLMTSGLLLSLMYGTPGSTWVETSRGSIYGSLGMF